MIPAPRSIRIWACAEPVNMRKSFDGLFAEARLRMGRHRVDHHRETSGEGAIQRTLGRGPKKALVPDAQRIVAVPRRQPTGRSFRSESTPLEIGG